MKKKILSLALALALCLGLAVPAFAETTWTETINGITITAYPSGSISYTGTGKLSAEHAERGADAVWSMTKVDDSFTFSISVGQGITITNEFKNVWMDRGLSVSYNNSVDRTVGGFTDVAVDDYFADPVLWAVNKKITAGTSDTTFSPNQNCTVAQILTFLWRAYDSTTYRGKNPFSDVKTSDYYYNAARWAYDKGMVTDSAFGGDKPCTRAMAVTYMWKAAGSPAASYDGKFDDVPATADYAQAVAWAVENGVTSGTSATTFSPDSVCTRGQIVTFLHRALAK